MSAGSTRLPKLCMQLQVGGRKHVILAATLAPITAKTRDKIRPALQHRRSGIDIFSYGIETFSYGIDISSGIELVRTRAILRTNYRTNILVY